MVSSFTLLTDFYQLTMAYGYWKAGIHQQEVAFNLFFRKLPFKGGYAVCAGLAPAIEFINNFRFHSNDIAYLRSLKNDQGKPLFEKAFLQYLSQLRFTADLDAMEEGEVVFPQQPLIHIKGPLLLCQLLETPLLTIFNFQTLIATKAARVCQAADWKSVVEFGLRRAQGPDGGLSAARAAYIGGCIATSNTLAGKLYNIPVRGTHAHSWVMAFPDELASFKAYAAAFPDSSILLVDTYNTLQGVKNAIVIGKSLKQQGKKLAGIRLDSGDMAKLSIASRKLLDAAGLNDAIIFASGDLDEYKILELKSRGAKIDSWGVGTHLTTAYDQPALDGVYKLAAIRDGKWHYKLKLSEDFTKMSAPGLLKVRRFFKNDVPVADVIYDEQLGIPKAFTITALQDKKLQQKITPNLDYTDLMKSVFKAGQLVYEVPLLSATREKTITGLEKFDPTIRRIQNPKKYLVGVEEKLTKLKNKLLVETKRKYQKKN